MTAVLPLLWPAAELARQRMIVFAELRALRLAGFRFRRPLICWTHKRPCIGCMVRSGDSLELELHAPELSS